MEESTLSVTSSGQGKQVGAELSHHSRAPVAHYHEEQHGRGEDVNVRLETAEL